MSEPSNNQPEDSGGGGAGGSALVRTLRRVQHSAETVVNWAGRIGGWMLFVTVALVFLNTFDRYAFEFSPVWSQELEWYLLAIQVGLGIAYAWQHNDHIVVDVFSQYYSRTAMLWLNLLIATVIVIPSSIYLIKVCIPYIEKSYAIMEGSPNPGGMPYRFVPKSAGALAFALLIVQAVATAIKTGFEIFGVDQDRSSNASP